MATIVQQSAGTGNRTMASAITAGNTLVYVGGKRGAAFTQLSDLSAYTLVQAQTSNPHYAAMFYKTAGAAESTTLNIAAEGEVVGTWYEILGAATPATMDADTGSTVNLSSGPITVAANAITFAVAAQGRGGSYDSVAAGLSYTPGTGWTESLDDNATSGGPTVWAGHRTDSGSITASATNSGHAGLSGTDYDWAMQVVSFTSAPVPGFWLDFDRDGFDADTTMAGAPLVRMLPQGGSGVSDNITSDVISVQIDRVADVSGGSPIGTMTVRTKNTSGKYNPDNTASTVYGKFNPGTPVWFGCNADGTLSGTGQTVYGRFGGYLRTVAPIPTPGATDAPIAEWVFDDAMARYREAKCRVALSTTRTVATYRTAVLSAIGETRTDLATEADTLAMSGSLGVRAGSAPFTNYANALPSNIAPLPYRPATDKRQKMSALAVLEELNQIVGSRHFIAPADTKEDFYKYTTRNRQYKLGAAADASLTGTAGIADTSGYVLSIDGVVNAMSVEARPFRIAAQSATVWEYPNLPLSIDRRTAKSIVADFPDVVFDATIAVTSRNSSVTASLTSSGEGATIILSATTDDTVTALSVSGRQLIRLDPVLVEASDAASRAAYGERQGPSVSSDLITSEGAAEAIANYHIWAEANPRKTPSVTIYNRLSTLLPLDLFDVVTLTVSQLDVSARRFEIVGIHETWQRAASASMVLVAFTLDLRETPNQSALSLLTFGTSLYGGTDGFAP